MGAVHVTVTVKDSKKSKRKYEALFLEDTGATDSIAPASELKNAGIVPDGKMTYELADGRAVEYPFAAAFLEFMGDITGGRIIFGPEGIEPILGVTALESVGIVVDPKNHTLKRLPAIPLKSVRSQGSRGATRARNASRGSPCITPWN